MKALIVVDVQNDFMPGGSLAVLDADKILPVVNKLIDEFDDREEPIFFTLDSHPADHGSFASAHKVEPFTMGELEGLPQMMWPDHCVEGTRGAEIHGGVDGPVHVAPVLIKKGQDPKFDSYSGFADAGGRATDLLVKLGKKGVHVGDTLYVCGLATDYCVKATAIDAMKLGFKTVVVYDGCRGVDIVTEHAAAMQMLSAGVQLVYHRWL